ncbi:response regulator, partial [Vibrio sp. 10N.222.55.F12]
LVINEDQIEEDPKKLKIEALNEFRQIALIKDKNNNRTDEQHDYQPSYDVDQELIMCHLSILEGKLSEAITILKHIYSNDLVLGFYNKFHFNYLLCLLSFNKEFGECIRSIKVLLDESDSSPMLLKSQVELL